MRLFLWSLRRRILWISVGATWHILTSSRESDLGPNGHSKHSGNKKGNEKKDKKEKKEWI